MAVGPCRLWCINLKPGVVKVVWSGREVEGSRVVGLLPGVRV